MLEWLKRFVSTERSCKNCAVLKEQLHEARLREQRQYRQAEKLQDQIGMVLSSKFETVNVSGERPESNLSPSLPLDALMDVNTTSDEDFVAKAGVALN